MKKKNSQNEVPVDSMAAASSVMGLSLEEIKRCKESGSPAFKGSRVFCGRLERWRFEEAIGVIMHRLATLTWQTEEGKYFRKTSPKLLNRLHAARKAVFEAYRASTAPGDYPEE